MGAQFTQQFPSPRPCPAGIWLQPRAPGMVTHAGPQNCATHAEPSAQYPPSSAALETSLKDLGSFPQQPQLGGHVGPGLVSTNSRSLASLSSLHALQVSRFEAGISTRPAALQRREDPRHLGKVHDKGLAPWRALRRQSLHDSCYYFAKLEGQIPRRLQR